MGKGPYRRMDHAQVWAYSASGQLPADIGRTLGRPPDAIYQMIDKAGGIRPAGAERTVRLRDVEAAEQQGQSLQGHDDPV